MLKRLLCAALALASASIYAQVQIQGPAIIQGSAAPSAAGSNNQVQINNGGTFGYTTVTMDTFGNTVIPGLLTFNGVNGLFQTPSWATAPSTAAGRIGFNTTTGRYDFGIGGSVVNHVRLNGDAMTGGLTAPNLTATNTVAAQNLPRNIIAYGADPTNTTDSSSAFTACLAAVGLPSTNNVGCYVPPGSYKISATIRMPNCSGSNKSISIWGDPGMHPNAYPAMLNVANGVTAFAPACPLTAYQGVSIQNLEIFGGKNGIDLGYVNLTDLGHLTLWNQSGYGITHLQGEKHHWHDILIWHQTVQGIGGISLCDPTTTADATVYAGDSFWGVNNGWFDRATLEDITDMGNGASPQDSYFVHAAGPSGGNIGSGAISHTIFIKPVIMWAGSVKTWDIEGLLQWVTIEEPIFDIIGSASTPVTDVLYVAGGSNTVTLLDFSPTDSPGDYYTNGVHFVGGTNNVSIIDSNFGGDGTTTYGVRLDTVAGPLELINSTGYVQNNWSNVAFQYNGVSVIGGRIQSNLIPTYVSNTAGGDYRFYMPLLTPSNTNNCNNWRFSRGASSPNLAVLDDMYMGCSGVFFNVPLNMGGSSYFTGSAGAYSYWNWTNTNSGGGANNMTLSLTPTNPGTGWGQLVLPNFQTTNSAFKVGGIELQPYALNSSIITDNAYYNAGWTYRSTGAAGLFQFHGTEGFLSFNASGTGGTTFTPSIQLKALSSGTVALGGNVSPTAGSTSGASLVVTSTAITPGVPFSTITSNESGCNSTTPVLKYDGTCGAAANTTYNVAPTIYSGTAGIANTTLFTAPAAHYYMACLMETVTVAGTGGTVSLRLSGTADGNSNNWVALGAVNLNTQWNFTNGCGSFYADSGSAVQYSLYMPSATGTPSVRYAITVTQLQ